MEEDIIKRSSEFDLKKFFFNESDDEYCAIKIITPIQDICFATEYHDKGAEIIMRTIYSDFDEDFSSNAYWPEVCNDYGCIAIQIVKRNFIIVNIPDFINKYQFNELFSFYQDMIKINSVLRKNGEEIDIQTNVVKDGNFLNLGKALMVLKNKIVDFKSSNEKNIKI
ncbi:MAG: hypothetical protein IKF91_04090 [Bacilli bacterium]|nr:hypothetical protein [Bacilli bacterium]